MGLRFRLHGNDPEPLMSALGQKRTLERVRSMSALPPIADIETPSCDVRFVPKADILRCGKERRYSITSSASVSRLGGILRSSALAVARLMTRSSLVANSTGILAGVSPLRIRPA